MEPILGASATYLSNKAWSLELCLSRVIGLTIYLQPSTSDNPHNRWWRNPAPAPCNRDVPIYFPHLNTCMYSPINSGPAFHTRSFNRTYQPVRSRSISPRLMPLPSDSSSSSSDEASDNEVYLLPPPVPVIEDLSNMAEATLNPTPFFRENEDATV